MVAVKFCAFIAMASWAVMWGWRTLERFGSRGRIGVSGNWRRGGHFRSLVDAYGCSSSCKGGQRQLLLVMSRAFTLGNTFATTRIQERVDYNRKVDG